MHIGEIYKGLQGSTAFSGYICTMALEINFNLAPPPGGDDGAPDFIITAGKAKIGTARWDTMKKGRLAGRPFLKLVMDQPDWGQAMFVNAFPRDASGTVFDVDWRRPDPKNARQQGAGNAAPAPQPGAGSDGPPPVDEWGNPI